MAGDARPRRTIVAALYIALAGCDAPTLPGEAPAYDPVAISGGRIYRWPIGYTVRVRVHHQGVPSNLDLRGMVVRAAQAWEEGLAYREVRLRLTNSVQNTDVLMRVRQATSPLTGACSNEISTPAGFTLICVSGDSVLTREYRSGIRGRVKIEIVVDPAVADTDERMQALVTHEIGHALGIGSHSPVRDDVMFASPEVTVPSPRDQQTLRYVLHQPVEVRLSP